MSSPWFLFAPGAGAPSTSPWMSHWAKLLSQLGPVERFDYDYMRAGKRRPDRIDALLRRHHEALEAGQEKHGTTAYLVGKSMGGRVGCHLALTAQVSGVICLGYPLLGMGDPNKMRDQVLQDLSARALLIQGTRDKLCPLDVLDGVLKKRAAQTSLHVVETGDHSLLATKRYLKEKGLTQENLDEAALAAIARFLKEAELPSA